MNERFNFCPGCGTDLRTPDHTSHRTLGIEIDGAYDGVLFWECPDCEYSWHRWPEGTRQHEAARDYVTGDQAGPTSYKEPD